MHLFKSSIQDLDTSLSALPDNIELILLGDFMLISLVRT